MFAAGIRNLQEFAFDELGNLISVDNDGDHEGETERLVYLTEGRIAAGARTGSTESTRIRRTTATTSGWTNRCSSRASRGRPAYILPPSRPITPGRPGWPSIPELRSRRNGAITFFVSSFPGSPDNARVYAFRLKEEGAGFTLESDKVLLRGILTVGMKFGPDGALYLTDWITGWTAKGKGRIWKLDSPKDADTAMRTEVRTLLAADFTGGSPADLSGTAAACRHARPAEGPIRAGHTRGIRSTAARRRR